MATKAQTADDACQVDWMFGLRSMMCEMKWIASDTWSYRYASRKHKKSTNTYTQLTAMDIHKIADRCDERRSNEDSKQKPSKLPQCIRTDNMTTQPLVTRNVTKKNICPWTDTSRRHLKLIHAYTRKPMSTTSEKKHPWSTDWMAYIGGWNLKGSASHRQEKSTLERGRNQKTCTVCTTTTNKAPENSHEPQRLHES